MPRDPRYLPPGWSVEITTRTICGFYLLPATSQFARIFAGVLARAQEKYPVRIHAAVALRNHYHLLLTPDDVDQLADFMEFVNGNIAREAARLIEWQGPIWTDRYHHIPISPEPEALIARLRYLLSNTLKENLVARISEWEGLHSAEALIDGKPMPGMWYDRAIEYEANRQAERKADRKGTVPERIDRGAFMTPYELKLAPLPSWQNLPRARIRKRVARIVAEIEAAAAKLREELGTEPIGMDRIRHQNPLDRPTHFKSSPKPPCHAASKDMRDRFRQALRGFVDMFREASLKLQFGYVKEAIFPKNSFRPSLGFVRTGEEFDPLADAGGSRNFAILAAAAAA